VKVVIAAFGFGGEQFLIDACGDVQIVVVSAGA
jgi:hypothetical protein